MPHLNAIYIKIPVFHILWIIIIVIVDYLQAVKKRIDYYDPAIFFPLSVIHIRIHRVPAIKSHDHMRPNPFRSLSICLYPEFIHACRQDNVILYTAFLYKVFLYKKFNLKAGWLDIVRHWDLIEMQNTGDQVRRIPAMAGFPEYLINNLIRLWTLRINF